MNINKTTSSNTNRTKDTLPEIISLSERDDENIYLDNDLFWLSDKFNNKYTEIVCVRNGKFKEFEREDLKSVINVTHFYKEHFENYPRSKPSNKPIKVLKNSTSVETENYFQKPDDFYEKQFLLWQRNRKIKKTLNDFMFSQITFTNSSKKKRINFYLQPLWWANKILLKLIAKKNWFRTDSKDMIDAIHFRLTKAARFTNI